MEGLGFGFFWERRLEEKGCCGWLREKKMGLRCGGEKFQTGGAAALVFERDRFMFRVFLCFF
jgi:hypothetical protein